MVVVLESSDPGESGPGADTLDIKIPWVLRYRRYETFRGGVERAAANRALVLAAAREVFLLARGYHGATLEQIAEEAGFSKGVVYSQFEMARLTLFLALLEARVEERAAENVRVARSLVGGGLQALLEHLIRGDQATPGWLLLVIEFRVHAARDPVLSRRFAAVPRPHGGGGSRRRWPQCSGTVAKSRRSQHGGWPSWRWPSARAPRSSGPPTPDAFGGPRVAVQVAHVLESMASTGGPASRAGHGHDRSRRASTARFPVGRDVRRADRAPGPVHAAAELGDPSELAACQRERLRVLLAHAAEHSPFHAGRLRGLEVSGLEVDDLARLPVMTKVQMMARLEQGRH